MLGVVGIGSKKLNGAFPLVECVPTGLRKVEKWTGSAWAQDDDAHKNPGWAAIEMWTNQIWGGGKHFSKALNVDTASAKLAADWCDESVTLEGTAGGDTEVRARFDAVLDTKGNLFAIIRE